VHIVYEQEQDSATTNPNTTTATATANTVLPAVFLHTNPTTQKKSSRLPRVSWPCRPQSASTRRARVYERAEIVLPILARRDVALAVAAGLANLYEK
jgi:hypothetical protein